MVAAITTYMVIFIQFMPKEDPTNTTATPNATDPVGNATVAPPSTTTLNSTS